MLLIQCPYCGEDRPELEFRHAGEAHIARPETITETSDADFEAFLYLRSNPKGIIYERWRHVHGCGRFFNAVRDTVTDRFFTTYKAGMPKPDPARFARAAAAVEPIATDAPVVATETRKTQPAAPAKAPRKAAAAIAPAAEAPAAAPAEAAADESPAGAERKSARGARRAAAPSNSAAPAAEPKPRRGSARGTVETTAAPDAPDAPAAPEAPAGEPKPARTRRKATPAGAAPDAAGEAMPDPATASAPKRTRKSPAKKGEA